MDMLETNATFILAKVRQDTRYQILQVLERYKVTRADYTEIPPAEPGGATVGRFEITIPDADEVDVQRFIASFLRSATGYQAPDARIVATRAYYVDNAPAE